MYKNLYHSGEYNIKESPYRLRGVFLSKGEKLRLSLQKKEEVLNNKFRQLNEKVKELEREIKSKQKEIEKLKKKYETLIIENEKKAKSIIENAEKEGEEIKKTKEKEGFDEGFEKGYYEGIEKGKNEVISKYAELLNTLKNITDSALEEKHKIIKNSEQDIITLSSDIARKIIKQEISLNKEVIINFVKEGIKQLENKEKIIIYANPDDLQILKQYRDEFKKLADIDELHILPDDLLDKGECKLESKTEIIDTDINYQLDEIEKKLIEEK